VPEEANKRGERAIGLTCSLLTVVARAGRSPAMVGGEAVAARPPWLSLRGNAGDARPSRAPGGSRECSGRAMGHWFSSGARGKEEAEGFIGPGTCIGGFASPSWPTGAREWARRWWRRAAEPAANGAWRFARRRVRTGGVAPA
jgi:hypothetical protein